MDHIKYSKNVLDPERLRDLKDLCTKHINEIPTYNFCRKTQESSNYLEEIIRHLIGRDNHVEYWVRNALGKTLFHVDGNELQAKYDEATYGGQDPDMKQEFALNTHILYVNIDPKMEGGELIILPYTTFIQGREILDTSFVPIEGTDMLVIKPKENDLVLFDKPLYHAITEVRNRGVIKNRISFMFSSWDYVPKIYEKHEHWSNYSPYIDKHPPKPMEFNLI
tara:strand:+ start:60 stop:725 length:666 start_codon:yes stop_codon:yes gene_type:complete